MPDFLKKPPLQTKPLKVAFPKFEAPGYAHRAFSEELPYESGVNQNELEKLRRQTIFGEGSGAAAASEFN